MNANRLMRRVSELLTDTMPDHARWRAAKEIVAMVWNEAHEIDRREMFNRIDFETFKMDVKPLTIEEILECWGFVEREEWTGWDHDFVRHVSANKGKRAFSAKEQQHIRRLYRTVIDERRGGDEVVEDG